MVLDAETRHIFDFALNDLEGILLFIRHYLVVEMVLVRDAPHAHLPAAIDAEPVTLELHMVMALPAFLFRLLIHVDGVIGGLECQVVHCDRQYIISLYLLTAYWAFLAANNLILCA